MPDSSNYFHYKIKTYVAKNKIKLKIQCLSDISSNTPKNLSVHLVAQELWTFFALAMRNEDGGLNVLCT